MKIGGEGGGGGVWGRLVVTNTYLVVHHHFIVFNEILCRLRSVVFSVIILKKEIRTEHTLP